MLPGPTNDPRAGRLKSVALNNHYTNISVGKLKCNTFAMQYKCQKYLVMAKAVKFITAKLISQFMEALSSF